VLLLIAVVVVAVVAGKTGRLQKEIGNNAISYSVFGSCRGAVTLIEADD
jgi:hypothetical protein